MPISSRTISDQSSWPGGGAETGVRRAKRGRMRDGMRDRTDAATETGQVGQRLSRTRDEGLRAPRCRSFAVEVRSSEPASLSSPFRQVRIRAICLAWKRAEEAGASSIRAARSWSRIITCGRMRGCRRTGPAVGEARTGTDSRSCTPTCARGTTWCRRCLPSAGRTTARKALSTCGRSAKPSGWRRSRASRGRAPVRKSPASSLTPT